MCVICSRPLRWRKAIPWRKIPIPTERGQEGGGMRNFRKNLMLEGAGGPGALQTSPPVRMRKSFANFSARGPTGLTCRASPANSSIAGAAPLDSVRLRRNCSLLLCETQSSSLTCARGALRACAREKTRVLLQCQAVLSHALAQSAVAINGPMIKPSVRNLLPIFRQKNF